MAVGLIAMVVGLIVAWRGGDQSVGFGVIREVHVRLLAGSAAVWGFIAFVWLCCVSARAKGYHPALGLVGVTILGGLVIPFLPSEPAGPLARRPPFAWIGARHLFALSAAWVLVVLAFWNSFDSLWVLDNLYIIKYDPRTRAETWGDPPGDTLLRTPGVKNYFIQDYWWPKGISGLYRPLTGLTYWLNWTVLGPGGEDPLGFKAAQMVRGFHAVNLVLHWMNAALVYALAFVLTRRWGTSVLASLIFAVHPITTESVTNIIGRADLFAALAVLGGLLVWRWGAELPGWWKLAGFILVMLITAFGVFAKESSIAIGLLLLVFDLAYRWNPTVAKWLGALLLVMLVPAISGPSFAVAQIPQKFPELVRLLITAPLVVCAVVLHVFLARQPDRVRLIGLGGTLLIAVAASALAPAAGVALVCLIILAEYFVGPWLRRSFPDFDRIKVTAFLYTAAFVLLVFIPLWFGSYMWFKAGAAAKHSTSLHCLVGPMNVLLGPWQDDIPNQAFDWVDQYVRAGLLVAAGMLVWIYFIARRPNIRAAAMVLLGGVPFLGAWLLSGKYDFSMTAGQSEVHILMTVGRVGVVIAALAIFARPRERDSRPLPALPVVFLAAMFACCFVFWGGLVLSFIVGLMELIARSAAPRALRESPRWRNLVQRFVVGYYLLLPPVIAMVFVRYWIFNIQSTPPETPFLDNPLRGGPFDPLGFWQSRLTAIKVIGKLIYRLFWPVRLSSDYSWDQLPFFTWRLWQWENFKTIVALAVIIGLLVLACRNINRNKPLFFFIMFFFAALLPTSNLPTLIGSIMAERFLYLPLIGFAGAVAVLAAPLGAHAVERLRRITSPDADPDDDVRGFPYFPGRAVVLVGIPCALLTLLTARAYVRNFAWRDDIRLWEAAMLVSPRSFRCYQSLAFAFYEENARQNVDRMISIAEQARPIVDPLPNDRNSSRLYLHLGMYYNIKGEVLSGRDDRGNFVVTPACRPWFEKAARVLEQGMSIDRSFNEVNRRRQLERGDKPDKILDAGLTPIYMTLGISYMRLGMYREAFNAFSYQRQLEPESSDPYVRIALLHIDQGRLEEAAVALVQALLLDFRRPDAWALLAQLYGAAGPMGQDAILGGPQGPRLNVDNPLVRDHFIRAYRGFIRIFRFSNRPQAAETARRVAVYRYRMPPSLFDSVMVEPIKRVTPEGLEDIKPATAAGSE